MDQIHRRKFFRDGILLTALAGVSCGKEGTPGQSTDKETVGPQPPRAGSPVYLTDLDRCLPQTSLSRRGKLFTWRLIDYEAAPFRGVMLRGGPETAADTVTYPLEAKGWHDVHVGLFNTAWRPFHAQRLWIKLKQDPAYSLVYLPEPTIDKGPVIQDCFWKTADLTDQEISFKQLCHELVPEGESSRSTCETVWVAYIKLIPLTEEERRAAEYDHQRTDTKCLVATQDIGTGMVVDSSAGSVRDLLETYRHTDFQRIYWEAAAGDLCSYFTKVGRMWTRDQVSIQDYSLPECRRLVENWTQYLEQDTDPFRIAVEFAHDVGLEFHSSYRFAEGMGPFHFSPPFGEVNRGGFYERHPELRAIRRDRSRAPRISLSFPETRRFLLELFREMAEYPVDGICPLFNRRPPYVEYEPPLVETFRSQYGADPFELEERDPRWLEHRCAVLTEFMRDLRRMLDEVAAEQGRPKALSAWVFGRREENLFYGFDVETWIEEGLVDTVVPYTSAEGLFSWQPAWENPDQVRYWLELTSDSSCELVLNILPRHLTPEQYRLKARDLYRQGIEKLAFWDSAKIWGIEHHEHSSYYFGHGSSLPWLKRLGHREELEAWFKAGEPTIALPHTRLKKVGDWEMTFIAE